MIEIHLIIINKSDRLSFADMSKTSDMLANSSDIYKTLGQHYGETKRDEIIAAILLEKYKQFCSHNKDAAITEHEQIISKI